MAEWFKQHAKQLGNCIERFINTNPTLVFFIGWVLSSYLFYVMNRSEWFIYLEWRWVQFCHPYHVKVAHYIHPQTIADYLGIEIPKKEDINPLSPKEKVKYRRYKLIAAFTLCALFYYIVRFLYNFICFLCKGAFFWLNKLNISNKKWEFNYIVGWVLGVVIGLPSSFVILTILMVYF